VCNKSNKQHISHEQLTSLNVKGAESAIKRRKILLYLKQKNPDLVFMQETHLDKEDSLLLQRDWVGKVLYSARSFSQRGVAILIWKNFNIKILKQQSDEERRWSAIDAELFGIRCTFMNRNTPTAALLGFFVEVNNEITQFGNSYVVLDYFLLSKSLLSMTKQTTIGTILVSDHAPVGLSLRLGRLSKLRPTRWIFNSSLFKDEQSVEFIKREMLDYWLNNEGSVSNPAVKWDVFKAVIRGRVIQHCSYLKKKSVQLLHELEVDIKKMEKMHSTQSDLSILLELNKLKAKYNSILQKKVEYTLFRTKHKYYEQGETTGIFLAQRAKQQYTQ
uniref:exodeoxyribonuclease III n=1 Tax=Mola mola TaxID=94237 RepID=A0A3Q4BMS6_MOLML